LPGIWILELLMSFNRFIYYCAIYAGCAAFVGWALGWWLAGQGPLGQASVKGMFLGLWVTLVLLLIEASIGLVEALRNASVGQFSKLAGRIGIAAALGALSGLIGGFMGQLLYGWIGLSVFLIFGWTLTGLLIGASLGVPDWIRCYLNKQDAGIPLRRSIKGALGGTVGGILGGVLFLVLTGMWSGLFAKTDKPIDQLWSPSAIGFVVLGICIGLAIALAQVILREAWVRVEQGFRAGREVLVSKPEVSIGRAESCDIGLYGDAQIEKTHAFIRLRPDQRYELIDKGTPNGTYLNERRIAQPSLLQSGDMIRVGRSVLCFQERAKDAQPGARRDQPAPSHAAPAVDPLRTAGKSDKIQAPPRLGPRQGPG
jgi:hypothetical protein